MGRNKQENTKPYLLPEPLYCDPEEIRNGITMDLVNKYIKLHENRMRRYVYLENLYKGFHDIFRQPEKQDWNPDWRLAVNFPRYLTVTFAGYGYGLGIGVTHEDDNINASIRAFEKRNEMKHHNSVMIRRCCEYGHAFEYIYQDENANTCVKSLTPKELFVVYDDHMKERALFAVRYDRHTKGGHLGEPFGEILGREMIEPFDKGRKLPGEAYENWYAPRINVVEWMLNDDRMGLYESVAGLVELYDHTISEKSNDVDSFAEAILALFGPELDLEQVEDMRRKRILNIFGQSDEMAKAAAEYLVKPSADGTQENLLDRIERLIYQIAMVANISDESFGSATSGAALAYKLWSTSNLVMDANTLIEKSIRKRMKLWCTFDRNTTNKNVHEEIDIHFLPNVPDNASEQIDNLQKLDGHVSTRTKLSAAPAVVPDPDAEIERMQQEEAERLQIEEERQSQYMGFSQKLQPEVLLNQLRSEADSRQVTLQELIGQLEGSGDGEEQS